MDEQIGRLRDELRTLGIEKETILFFTSDNGASGHLVTKGVASNAPFRGSKHTMYEGGLRVPTVVEWPGNIPAGTTSNALTSTVDYLPTVLELTESKFSKSKKRPIDGISLVPALAGETPLRPTPLFFGFQRLITGIDGQALIDERYKLLRGAEKGGGKFELYDLKNDPGEANDLSSAQPDRLEEMKRQMLSLIHI